ncbi:uncharacterized protein At3g06530 isoform X1 [Rhodamnia argentea]|uniref:Uncharacterized protein At3g06530 isoform X1 n=2 Tax=Rhodamnia argentea TaxID=178133 RepID=A0A8B8PEB8_9MYRT|nr:uncharacterized protein At3g06530 isoform X1 [Rhodamnia argentea]
MAASLSSQLQAIKSYVQADSEPLKRPFTRPSVLFNPKEASDIDIDTIHDIALSGLEVLVNTDQRFGNYKNDLFSHKSKELDRELMNPEENERINVSITSFLRLLSSYLQLVSSLRTLEYLIRRYKIHVYNMEELILCALPYHDTHAFVRIVQLLNLGNTKWKFLEGVKVSGAPPPRQVVVQQCIRDMGILEVLCNYASPAKKHHPSSIVVNFCTAVVIEAVGSLAAVESDVVKRILPFVISGIQPGMKGGSEHKASALMIVSLLAKKAALSPKLVKSLIRSIADIAREEVKDAMGLQWVRLSFMALINLLQSQSVDVFPKKALEIVKEIRDITGILSQLSREFNIDKFLVLFLESLLEYSFSDASCCSLLVSIVETVPLGNVVDCFVSKVLFSCLKLSQKNDSSPSEIGVWAKKILVVILKSYPSELHDSIRKFLENTRLHQGKQKSISEVLSKVLDGNLSSSVPMLDSKIWFSLYHPKVEVRCAALSSLNVSGILKADSINSQGFETIQDAISRQLHDNDLSIVQAALLLNELPNVVNRTDLLQALCSITRRCIGILVSSSVNNSALAGDIVILCLKHLITMCDGSLDSAKELAALMFPLLLITPKTQMYNLRVLELAKEVKWPLYQNLPSLPSSEKLEAGSISSANLRMVDSLADLFSKQPQEFLPFLVQNSNDFMMSKTLFFLVLLQSIEMKRKDGNRVLDLLEACLPVLKSNWEAFKSSKGLHLGEDNVEIWRRDCIGFLDQLFDVNIEEMNGKILICIFWRMLEAFISVVPTDLFSHEGVQWVGKLREIFVLLADSNQRQVLREHLHYLVTNCKICAATFLSQFFTEEGYPVAVQVESLLCFAHLCGQAEDALSLQLLGKFPSLLVPLASESQDIRIAAMNCIEGLYTLCSRVDLSGKKNGTIAIWSRFLEELLGLIIQHKRLILSDRKFLASFLSALLGPLGIVDQLLVPQDVGNRLTQSTKKEILDFILESALQLSSHGKLVILSLLRGIGEALMQVKDVELLLSKLLESRDRYYFERDNSYQRLSKADVEILCLLLSCTMSSTAGIRNFEDHLLKALHFEGSFAEDTAVVLPCIAVLSKLNSRIYGGLTMEMQEALFSVLVVLFRKGNSDIQIATKEALLRLDVVGSTVSEMLLSLSTFEVPITSQKKKRRSARYDILKKHRDVLSKGKNAFSFLISLLDILLMKKDITNRESLISPLFKLLGHTFSDEWVHFMDERSIQAASGISEGTTSSACYVQQNLLLVLEDILSSVGVIQSKAQMLGSIDVELLIRCAHSAKDGVTHNHILKLLSTIAKLIPDKILDHIQDILTVAGESAITQVDSSSLRVFEELMSSLLPCWLSKTNDIDQLLQVFVNILPEVAEKRRLSIVTHLMRTLGERSLASLLFLLFQSLITRKRLTELDNKAYTSPDFMAMIQMEWEYAFAVHLCEHYPCMMWLPSLVILLRRLGRESSGTFWPVDLLLVMLFISQKLQDPELAFALESRDDLGTIQGTLEELMEQVVYLWQLVDTKKEIAAPAFIREGIKYHLNSVIITTTTAMIPSSYFKGMIKLLDNADHSVKRKALVLFSKSMKHLGSTPSKRKEKREFYLNLTSSWLHLDEGALEALNKMCLDIIQLLDASVGDSNTSLKLAAVSAMEVLANRFPSNYSIFNHFLASVVRNIKSPDATVSSSCLRTAGTLINVLGAKALIHLPSMMENVMRTLDNISSFNAERKVGDDASNRSLRPSDLLLSILIPVEAVVDKLGGFLNPYLESICKFLVLHPDLVSGSDIKLRTKGETVRKLIAEKIPVRLALPPLLNLYSGAVVAGDFSLTIIFEMLSHMVATMDRTSVAGYYKRIFDLCLSALDLRRQRPLSVRNISAIEKSVINSMILLTMKLTETMFKPLFIRTVEWAELEVDESENRGRNLDRAISMYGLVNKLAENHRSLFVPYFKYLLESSVRHLADAEEASLSLKQKKKKSKISETGVKVKEANSGLSLQKWQIRALVLSALHKCFLYDTGSLKLLDSSTFQVLLKPIVSQLGAEPPHSVEDHPDVPSVKEVDDLVVICTGQMAVTAGSDLLWKPLNHEVLMQTRSEKVRSRILGLRIVKYLLENLKEEYLIFLPETIPFLGELLEDVEPTVKSLAQEILKEMESMSGESLRQYL